MSRPGARLLRIVLPANGAHARGDAGFTLVEVIAAMAVFAIIATASMSILINGLKAVRQNNDRVLAASIARSEVDRLRQLGAYSLTAGTATRTVTQGSKTFTVTTTANWVPLDNSGYNTSTCSLGNNSDPEKAIARVRVSVSGAELSGPQSVDAVILPNESTSISNVGTVTITVKDQANAVLADATISMVNPATGQTLLFTTDANGCVIARNVPTASTWNATASKTGYITKVATDAVRTGTVLADQNTSFAFSLARAGNATITTGSTTWPYIDKMPFTFSPPAGVEIPASVTIPSTITASPFTITGLWADPTAYSAWQGCPDASSYATSVPITTGGTTAVTLGGVPVEIIGPRSTKIEVVSAAVTPSGVCTTPITLNAGTTGKKGKLQVTMPYGRWKVKSFGTDVKTVMLRSSNTQPCSVALVPTTPTITSVSPATVALAGGTTMTINGTNLGDKATSTVTIGSTPATITAGSATSLTVVTPAKAAGLYALTVTSPQGVVTEADVVTYASSGLGGSWVPSLDSSSYAICPSS